MFRICQTREDRLANAKYFQNIREITTKIRDDYDRVKENKFHRTFYAAHARNKGVRPDFMEPLPKNFRK